MFHLPSSSRGNETPIILLLAILLVATAVADDGFWTKAGNGSWTDVNNWDSGVVADGTDNTAYFGVFTNVSPNMTVTLDGARTIGDLFFTDQGGSNNVILNTGSGGP